MARHSVLHTFYASDLWRNFRLSLIAERGNKCQRCGRIIGRSIDIIGHHKIELTPDNVHDHLISLNPIHVELICHQCHNIEHDRFVKVEKKVYIVYGPPLSGKTTHVIQHKGRNDLVLDYDRLYEAVTMLSRYDKPDGLWTSVNAIHNHMIDNVKTRFGKWRNAWIIGGYPERFKRERTADDVGAELVFIDVSKDECLSRLSEDEDRKHVQTEWRDYIDKWFEKYQP